MEVVGAYPRKPKDAVEKRALDWKNQGVRRRARNLALVKSGEEQ